VGRRLLICAEDVNLWGGGDTNPVTLLHSSNKTGLEINVQRTEYMISLVTNVQEKAADGLFENVAKLRYIIRKLVHSIFSVQWVPT
jgi:hypothetical protein